MSEAPDQRLKRMAMRSWRRGTKEMDLILGPFSDARLGAFDATALDLYDALLAENDQDLYPWITARLGEARPAASPPALPTSDAFRKTR